MFANILLNIFTLTFYTFFFPLNLSCTPLVLAKSLVLSYYAHAPKKKIKKIFFRHWVMFFFQHFYCVGKIEHYDDAEKLGHA